MYLTTMDIYELFDQYPKAHFYFITKFGKMPYTSFDYSETSADIFFVFGKETTGLPGKIIKENEERCLRIPMNDHIRALNLSNTAAILVYEAYTPTIISKFTLKKWDRQFGESHLFM